MKIMHLPKVSEIDYFNLEHDEITFHFNHCRYAGNNTLTFHSAFIFNTYQTNVN